jgi:hypothetical protein
LAYFRVQQKIEIDRSLAFLPGEFYQVDVKKAKGGAGVKVAVTSQTKLLGPTTKQYPVFIIPIERAREAEVEQIKD